MRNYWTRREFARNATLSALAAPFMSIFDPKLAKAQAAGGPAKYLLIFYSNGTDTDAWTPTGST
ncbi:MAG TPA: Tat pathway signal sequence, partial [Polyangiaceae bacterium]|nr:Tat pathway signal sequence [Polyangiaceae bacterium]